MSTIDAMPVHGGSKAEACMEVCIGSPMPSQIAPNTINSSAGNRVPISPEIEPTLAKRLPPRKATIVLIQYSTMITAAMYTPLLPRLPAPNTYERLTAMKAI